MEKCSSDVDSQQELSTLTETDIVTIRSSVTNNSLLPPYKQFTLRGYKVSMLAHTYPHKPPRKNNLIMCNHQADSPLCVASCLI